ncbi:hypothetical protein M3Y96_00100500 [Aphelenchoides besseyi]|nr:hypothetical protein M3Y96_00100500 [Aphelenchoides besseyi]
MTALFAISCFAIAFTPALAIFVKIVAKDPLRVILFFLGAFFWLLSVLISGLFAWPFSANILPIIFISALIQEAARVGCFSLLHRAQKDLEKVAANGVEVSSLRLSFASRHVLAVVCGLGIGVISALFILVNVLADYSSEGVVGLPASISKVVRAFHVVIVLRLAGFEVFERRSGLIPDILFRQQLLVGSGPCCLDDHSLGRVSQLRLSSAIALVDGSDSSDYRSFAQQFICKFNCCIFSFTLFQSTFAEQQKSIALVGQAMVFTLSSIHCYLILRKPTRFRAISQRLGINVTSANHS